VTPFWRIRGGASLFWGSGTVLVTWRRGWHPFEGLEDVAEVLGGCYVWRGGKVMF